MTLTTSDNIITNATLKPSIVWPSAEQLLFAEIESRHGEEAALMLVGEVPKFEERTCFIYIHETLSPDVTAVSNY